METECAGCGKTLYFGYNQSKVIDDTGKVHQCKGRIDI